MLRENLSINVTPGGVPVIIHISQYDIGLRTFVFSPYTSHGTFTPDAAAAATLEGTKPDGNVIIHNCEYNASTGEITYTVQEQLAAVPGKVWSKLTIRDTSGGVIGYAAIIWMVDMAGVEDGAIASDSDISALQEFIAEFGTINAYKAALDGALAAVGGPYVASTVAQMTDHTKVYVYTGSQTGYTAGHWYYWNGSAWTDGGVYQAAAVETDKTLTVADMAADAKATGNAVSANANNIYKKSSGKYTFSMFEQGLYNQTTGVKEDSTSYVRSVEKIPVTSNILVTVCDVPDGHARSDYGVRFASWDRFLNFLGITTQVSSDALVTSIPANAAYIAIEVISRTEAAITVSTAPAVNIGWFDLDLGGADFTEWIDHASYSSTNQRLSYGQNSAFSAKSMQVDPDLRYMVSSHSNTNIRNIYVWEFDSTNTFVKYTQVYHYTDGYYISIKPDATTKYIRISVNFTTGTYYDPGTVTIEESDAENLLPTFGLYTNETVQDPNDSSKTVTITWDSINGASITGVMSASWNNYQQRIYYDVNNLPDGIAPGDKLWFSLNNIDNLEGARGKLITKNVALAVIFFFGSTSNRTANKYIYETQELVVPENATGMQLVLRVQRGISNITLLPSGGREVTYVYDVDSVISDIHIYATKTDIDILGIINKNNLPCLVSFIDDDAESDLFCGRYYNACMHNGITGAYAVETDRLDEGVTTAATMLQYEQKGMGMLTHCTNQSSIYRAATEADIEACMADMVAAKRKMIERGFVTYNHFVIPYGTKSDDLRDLARYCGFDSAISTSDNVINHITDNDRYYIKRFGYLPEANYQSETGSRYNACLKLINEMIQNGSGWVIVTTHFCDDWSPAANQWQTYPYNTALDANGYEIGYTEFNDLITAIKATGAKIVPYTVGFNYFHSGARG